MKRIYVRLSGTEFKFAN